MRFFFASIFLTVSTGCGWAQFIGSGLSQTAPKQSAPVEAIASAPFRVPANKPAKITLHFRIAEGLHINSHTPHDEFLIPTLLSFTTSKGVKIEHIDYPAGVDMKLPDGPKEMLNVYMDQIFLDARIVASAGNHPVEGKLRYQACDQHECMPPRSIPVHIEIIAQ